MGDWDLFFFRAKMNSEHMSGKDNDTKQLIRGAAIYTGAFIMGPLLVFGGAGYFLDRHFGTKPIITLIAVFLAFVISNVLLFKKAMIITERIKQIGDQRENAGDVNDNDSQEE